MRIFWNSSTEYPESDTIEFKETLPTKDPALEPWLRGEDRILDGTRNKILAEVIAFANAGGGQLLIGVVESEDHPKRATGIKPVPRCAALADKLSLQARDCIEPSIPVLAVRGIPTETDGSGVVILRVAASPLAPHRCRPNLECYIRHADRTQTMTMREIRDLVMQRDRGGAALDNRFSRRQEQFGMYVNSLWEKGGRLKALGMRATLLPTITPLSVAAVYRNPAVNPVLQEFEGSYAEKKFRLSLPTGWHDTRPIFGGVRYRAGFDDLPLVQEIHRDGLIELTLAWGSDGLWKMLSKAT